MKYSERRQNKHNLIDSTETRLICEYCTAGIYLDLFQCNNERKHETTAFIFDESMHNMNESFSRTACLLKLDGLIQALSFILVFKRRLEFCAYKFLLLSIISSHKCMCVNHVTS